MTDTSERQRDLVESVARSWLRTPYHDLGEVKGAGCDCATLLKCVYVEAGVIAPFEYSPLIWGTMIGYLVWAELPAWTTLAGAAVVIAAGVYNLHRERLRRMQARAAAAEAA